MLIVLDRFVLRDDALVELVFELQQPLGFFFFETGKRNAGHLADDLGDDFVIDDAVHFLSAFAPLALHFFFLGAEAFGRIAKLGGLFVFGVADGFVLLNAQTLDLFLDLGEIRGLGHAAQTDASAGFVEDVDGLVRKAPAGDVTVGKLDGGREGRVENLNAVVGFVAVAQALENFHGVGRAGRIDGDRLESPGKGSVFLDVFSVFIERGGADALDLTAGEGGLEHVAGVDRAFGAAGADQRVKLVDEEDDVLGPADFVHDRLDALLELAAIFGAGDHHGQIEHDDPAVVQEFGDGAGDDHLGEALDDGGLAHARFTQQNRVVLLPAAKDLDDPLDLLLTADDRVELPFAGKFGQVPAEAVQRGGFALAVLTLFFLCLGFFAFHASSQKIENLFPNFFQLQTQVH